MFVKRPVREEWMEFGNQLTPLSVFLLCLHLLRLEAIVSVGERGWEAIWEAAIIFKVLFLKIYQNKKGLQFQQMEHFVRITNISVVKYITIILFKSERIFFHNPQRHGNKIAVQKHMIKPLLSSFLSFFGVLQLLRTLPCEKEVSLMLCTSNPKSIFLKSSTCRICCIIEIIGYLSVIKGRIRSWLCFLTHLSRLLKCALNVKLKF